MDIQAFTYIMQSSNKQHKRHTELIKLTSQKFSTQQGEMLFSKYTNIGRGVVNRTPNTHAMMNSLLIAFELTRFVSAALCQTTP